MTAGRTSCCRPTRWVLRIWIIKHTILSCLSLSLEHYVDFICGLLRRDTCCYYSVMPLQIMVNPLPKYPHESRYKQDIMWKCFVWFGELGDNNIWLLIRLWGWYCGVFFLQDLIQLMSSKSKNLSITSLEISECWLTGNLHDRNAKDMFKTVSLLHSQSLESASNVLVTFFFFFFKNHI